MSKYENANNEIFFSTNKCNKNNSFKNSKVKNNLKNEVNNDFGCKVNNDFHCKVKDNLDLTLNNNISSKANNSILNNNSNSNNTSRPNNLSQKELNNYIFNSARYNSLKLVRSGLYSFNDLEDIEQEILALFYCKNVKYKYDESKSSYKH